MSLDVLLWAFLASYVIHIVDETTMNGGFIRWFQASFWPTYTARMNFWFNGGAVLAITGSNLLYDLFGGHWIILALIWPFGLPSTASRFTSSGPSGRGISPQDLRPA
ncbi:MAG TPA: hypothetical protein VND96_07040 [Candidatus Micrarchaeaceae archaeon]|nr:hypothetical protein [Candidatus Micrarchaeaceae archaeon]